MNDSSAARADIERWLVRYTQSPESKAFAPLADAYRAAGRLDEAVRVLESGLAQHPRYVSALVLLGLCQRDQHRDDAAEATFARVLDLDPDNLVALRYRAECARRRGVLERAVEYLRRALEIDPFDRDVQADLGLVTAALERQTRERTTPPSVRLDPLADPLSAAAALGLSPSATEPSPSLGRFVPTIPTAPAARPETPPSPPLPAPAASSPVPAPSVASARAASDTGAPPAPQIDAPVRGRAPVQPPPIDLRLVGRSEAEPAPPSVPPATVPEPQRDAPSAAPSWRFSRDDDRIVVAPTDTPVRGPIRSVEDRLFSEQRGVRPPAPPAPAAAPPPAAPRDDEFATLTLARIYESQGYFDKAIVIYEELLRKRPGDRDVTERLAAVQRRRASAAESGPPAASPSPPQQLPPAVREPAEEEQNVAWRLLDPAPRLEPGETAARLRRVTEQSRSQEQARAHTIVRPPPSPVPSPRPEPLPPPGDAPAADEPRRGPEDYQRFLAYLRSLRP